MCEGPEDDNKQRHKYAENTEAARLIPLSLRGLLKKIINTFNIHCYSPDKVLFVDQCLV